MQERTYTGFVARSEWRWVFLVSMTLILFSFSPLVVISVLNPPNQDWQFMGALHDYEDSAASMARIRQGAEGRFLTEFTHTSESHKGALIHPIYALIGQFSRLTIQAPILWFHLARIIMAIFMYLSIYQLGASIWVKIQTRRIFFIIAAIGGGFGWLYALLTGLRGDAVIPDLMLPQAFPFYSATVNVHYPLAITCIAWLASVIVPVLRPGATEDPAVGNEGLIVFFMSLLLAFVYPDALLPLGVAYSIVVAIDWFMNRKSIRREILWGLWILVPALPLIAYDLLTLFNNDYVNEWIIQRGDRVPSPVFLIVSLGLPLIIALPALYRAVRKFEPDGDRFMLIWFISMIIAMYLPFGLKQYYIVGLMLPVAYFATRAVADFWFDFIKRRYRSWVYVVIVPLMMLSHVLWLYLPIVPIAQGWSTVDGNVLEQGYVDAFNYLDKEIRIRAVVLSAPEVGTWIPVWSNGRPVYGHPAETADAEEKRREVWRWYRANAQNCQSLLDEYNVRFVIVGPRENQLGNTSCLDGLLRVATSANVNVYAVQR